MARKTIAEMANRYMVEKSINEEIDGFADRPGINYDPFKSNEYPRTTGEEHYGNTEDNNVPSTNDPIENIENRETTEDKYERETNDKGSNNLVSKTYNQLSGVLSDIITKSEHLSKKLNHIIKNIPDTNREDLDKLDGIGDELYSNFEQFNDILTSITQMLGSVDTSREEQDENRFNVDRAKQNIDDDNNKLRDEQEV